MDRPPVWKMIKEAIENLNGKASYSEIKNYINGKWADVNESTINAQIIVLTVNQPSRIHYPENKNPRLANSPYDLLYTIGRGKVILYNPEEQGIWEIYENEFGGLGIRQTQTAELEFETDEEPILDAVLFPVEANLRDFLIKNLHTYRAENLQLFIDTNHRDGKEYPTGVGPIDILAINKNGDFFVFELKLSRGADRALGQLLRYMGWIKKNLANGKQVKGIIVANKMDEKIKYAVSVTTDISLYEFEMKFELAEITL